MAITSVDQALAGMQPPQFFFKSLTPTMVSGRPQSVWGVGGVPGPGSFDTTLNGVTLDCTSALVAGQIPFYNPGSGSSYLARLVGSIPNGGRLMLCDRLWHNGGMTAVTTAQAITSPTWPARDINGATAGAGVFLGLEYGSTGANNSPTVSVSYTNSGGVAGSTGTNTVAVNNSSVAGAFYPIGLVAGDVGVQSVQSITFSAAPTAGTPHLVAYRVIATLDLALNYCCNAIDILIGGMPQMFNGTVPFAMFVPISTAAGYASGQMTVTQG